MGEGLDGWKSERGWTRLKIRKLKRGWGWGVGVLA